MATKRNEENPPEPVNIFRCSSFLLWELYSQMADYELYNTLAASLIFGNIYKVCFYGGQVHLAHLILLPCKEIFKTIASNNTPVHGIENCYSSVWFADLQERSYL